MTTATATRTFVIDKAHSEVVFQVRHLITKVRGRFSDFEGTIIMDETNPAASSATAKIKASSIDTNEPDRDKHLRSPDFFDAEKFADLTFQSTRITRKDPQHYDVSGKLTIHGVTKDVTLPVTYLGLAKDPWGKERAGFETELIISRKEYGLEWNAALETGGFLVGDEVKISLSIQAVGQ